MSEEEVSPENLDNLASEEEGEEGEATPKVRGEDQTLEVRSIKEYKDFLGEEDENEYFGEYGEGGQYLLFRPTGEEGEQISVWDEKGSVSSEAAESVVEETEEEKELKRETEALIESVKQKMSERIALRRRNAFLQKKLVDYFRKRRMENAFKEEPKGLDLERKYLNRLYAFQDFKQAQENEIKELTESMDRFEHDTKMLKEELDEKLKNFMTRAKEVSLNLILSNTGKKLSEKRVDLLLRRQIKKNEEKGRKKLQYIKIKNLIEEKERQLKAMEYIGEGLNIVEYEQMKIDNLNFSDKIEEKEDELSKMRLKTQSIMKNLSQVREKAYAIEGDIELMEETVYFVEKKFEETRGRLTDARKKRDSLREECARLKSTSGLLSKGALLRDFESSIYEAKSLSKDLEKMKKLMHEKEIELHKINLGASSGLVFPVELNVKFPSKPKDMFND